MIQRPDEGPVHLRLLAPGNNWSRVGAHLSLGLTGYYSRLGTGSTMSVVSGDTGSLATDSPRLVANGEFDLGMLTPRWYGTMARRGVGLFDAPLPLRALAILPHDDRLVMAVREETGITSLEQIVRDRIPLRVSMPPPEWRHPAGLVVDEVFREYGASVRALLDWGGTILYDRPRTQGFAYGAATEPVDGTFEAVFDEAIMAPRWERIFERYAMRILPIDEHVLVAMEHRGFERATIATGFWPHVEAPIPTIDFSGWVLFCRADLPDWIAYQTVAALDEQRKAISSLFPKPGSPLTRDLELGLLEENTGLELHPGAAVYYAEALATPAPLLAGTTTADSD